jgi:hypothetical protein
MTLHNKIGQIAKYKGDRPFLFLQGDLQSCGFNMDQYKHC